MKKIKLGDVLDVKRGASLSGEYYAEEGTLIRLTLGNFNYPNGGFKKNTSKADIFFTGPVKEEFILKKGDIITPLTEQVSGLLGETATIPEDDLYVQCGDVGLIIPDETKISKRFAYYLVSSPAVKKQLGAGAQQTKIRHTSPDAIKACEAWIPEELSDQDRIAGFFDDINEEISNTASICSDLEAMAKLLYDYWFVQLDFPDENGKPYKSSGGKMIWNEELKREIPEGWKSVMVSEITKRVKVGFVGTVEKHYCSRNEGFPIVRPAEMSVDGIDYSSLRHITSQFYESNKKSQVHRGDILLSRCGKDGIPNIYDSDEPGQVLNAVIIEPDESVASCLFVNEMLKSDYSQKQIRNMTTGSVQGVINTEKIAKILLPFQQTIVCDFTNIIQNYCSLLNNLKSENRQLIALRDFLLPMLMNGQVKLEANADS